MIKIVTDTEAKLPPALMERYDIHTVPLWVYFGQESYQEGVNITRKAFYERMVRRREFPQTSRASMERFVTLYRPLVEAGHEILSIHISSGLSGVYQSAVRAAEQFPGAKISVVDSRHATTGQAMIVWRAAEWIEAGLSRQAVIARLQPMIRHIRLFFVVDTLEYLRRGGRIGGATALLGTLLRVKPILTLNDGLIELHERSRTRKRALARLKELVLTSAQGNTGVDLGVVHVQRPDDAQMLAKELSAELQPKHLLVDLMGPGVGVHVGPGMIGAGVYCDEWADR